MHLPPHSDVSQSGGRAENGREGERIAAHGASPHEGVEAQGIEGGAILGVALEHGVVEEELWVGNGVEDVAGEVHGVGEGAAEEELAEDEVIAGEASFDDMGVEEFEGG